MSRIGRSPVVVPSGVDVKVSGRDVSVKGPKGSLSLRLPDGINAVDEDGGKKLVLLPAESTREHRARHGLARALVANMVKGVSDGFEKRLQLIGVGYRAQLQGNKLSLSIGFNQPRVFDVPKGLELDIPDPTRVNVRGCDKQLVGEFAAKIRRQRPPEPYKGKGIRYIDEHVRRKLGKSLVGE